MAVEIDGKTYRNLPEQVEENANNIQSLLDTIASFGNVMRYKGSVATYDDLPTEDNQVGDVWNVLDTGNNYAWAGEEWDEISSIVDLSGYPEKAQDETITGQWSFTDGILLDKPETAGNSKWRIVENQYSELSFEREYNGTWQDMVHFTGGSIYSYGTPNLGTPARPYNSLHLSGQVIGASNVFNVINASDISVSGTTYTLSQAQFDLITNGKPTLIKGTLAMTSVINLTDLVIVSAEILSSNVNCICLATSGYNCYVKQILVNVSSKQINFVSTSMPILINYQKPLGLAIGNKDLPAYPSNTGTFTLKCVDGVLTWVAD